MKGVSGISIQNFTISGNHIMHIKKRRALKVYAEEKCILSPNTACGLSHVQKKEKSASRKVSAS